MKIRGILFDKDGTLFKIDSSWVEITEILIGRVVQKYNLKESIRSKLSASVGIKGDGIIPNSILASGTISDMVEAFTDVISDNKMKKIGFTCFREYTIEEMKLLIEKHEGCFTPITDLQQVLSKLKDRGYFIGMATADIRESVIYVLKKKRLLHFFDYIGADDGYTLAKPLPEMIYRFCQTCSLKHSEVAVIGDSLKDMEFARNGSAGLAIGVLSGTSTREDLKDIADLIFPSIVEVFEEGVLF